MLRNTYMKQFIRYVCFGAPALLLNLWFLPQSFDARTQSNTIVVQVDKPRAAVSPNQFGIFFEDINFGADGGIYAELIKNRSFEFPDGLMGWSKLDSQGAAQGT